MYITDKKQSFCVRRIISGFVGMAFLCQSVIPVYAQSAFVLPVPGEMVHLSAPFTPPLLKAVKVNPDNPFALNFIIDVGSTNLADADLQQESNKLIRYFLASLTTPENDLWVNLSPYEKDRVVPNAFGVTEMGRDLLAQDYLLKQITATLMYPEEELGKTFWDKVYKKAYEKFGTTNIMANTFNKVWILPEKAVVYENGMTAFVSETKLKVMLEEDYKAMENNRVNPSDPIVPDVNNIGSQVVREIIIPELEKEVNNGKNFASLRQVYHSLVLANWYKKRLQDSILAKIYIGKNKVAGVDIDDKNEAKKIYEQYLAAFKKGVYNYIKEDMDPVSHEPMPRKYFSGGAALFNAGEVTETRQGMPPEAGRSSSSLREIAAKFDFSDKGERRAAFSSLVTQSFSSVLTGLRNSLIAATLGSILAFSPTETSAVKLSTAQAFVDEHYLFGTSYSSKFMSVAQAQNIMDENLNSMFVNFQGIAPASKEDIAPWLRGLISSAKTFDNFSALVTAAFTAEKDLNKRTRMQKDFLRAFYLFIYSNAQYDHEGLEKDDTGRGSLANLLVGNDRQNKKRTFICWTISEFALFILEEFGFDPKKVWIIYALELGNGNEVGPLGHVLNLIEGANGEILGFDGAMSFEKKTDFDLAKMFPRVVRVKDAKGQVVKVDLDKKDPAKALAGYRGDNKEEWMDFQQFARRVHNLVLSVNPSLFLEQYFETEFSLGSRNENDPMRDSDYFNKLYAQVQYYLNHPLLNEQAPLSSNDSQIKQYRQLLLDARTSLEVYAGDIVNPRRGVKVFAGIYSDYLKTMERYVSQLNRAQRWVNGRDFEGAEEILDALGKDLPLQIARFEEHRRKLAAETTDQGSMRLARSAKFVDDFRAVEGRIKSIRVASLAAQARIQQTQLYSAATKDYNALLKNRAEQFKQLRELLDYQDFSRAKIILDSMDQERLGLAARLDGVKAKLADNAELSATIAKLIEYGQSDGRAIALWKDHVDFEEFVKAWRGLIPTGRVEQAKLSQFREMHATALKRSQDAAIAAKYRVEYADVARAIDRFLPKQKASKILTSLKFSLSALVVGAALSVTPPTSMASTTQEYQTALQKAKELVDQGKFGEAQIALSNVSRGIRAQIARERSTGNGSEAATQELLLLNNDVKRLGSEAGYLSRDELRKLSSDTAAQAMQEQEKSIDDIVQFYEQSIKRLILQLSQVAALIEKQNFIEAQTVLQAMKPDWARSAGRLRGFLIANKTRGDYRPGEVLKKNFEELGKEIRDIELFFELNSAFRDLLPVDQADVAKIEQLKELRAESISIAEDARTTKGAKEYFISLVKAIDRALSTRPPFEEILAEYDTTVRKIGAQLSKVDQLIKDGEFADAQRLLNMVKSDLAAVVSRFEGYAKDDAKLRQYMTKLRDFNSEIKSRQDHLYQEADKLLLPGQKRASAAATTKMDEVGGIDLSGATGELNLEIRGNDAPVEFNFDPQQLENLQFDGLVPVIINIAPVSNLPLFLSDNPTPLLKSS